MISWIKKNRILFVCFLMPIFILSALFIVKGIYPFGSVSNLMWDMEVQYTDFFAYYRDVLLGNADISYSFSKSLGGSMIAIWGYYLASPLNLLVLFFKHSQLQLFVFVITALKLGLCGLTFGIFLKSQFKKLPELYVLFLSMAYSVTIYGLGQMSNIMWFDGMYMLPLMMLAVNKFISEQKVVPLYVTVALSVIFNWYSGYMNCIFIMIYFIYSYIISVEKFSVGTAIKSLFKFALTEITGVLASCIVFFPVLIGQSGGRSFDKGIFGFTTNGNLFEVLRGFMIGTNYDPDVTVKKITLFCSVFALMAVVCYFLNKSVAKREKIISGAFIGVMIASMYFAPIEHIWVGFKFEPSYAYRFLYVALAAFITVAARGMQAEPVPQKASLKKFVIGSIVTLFVLDSVAAFAPKRLWLEIMVLIAYGVIFALINTTSKQLKKIMTAALAVLFLGEISANAYWIISGYFNNDSAAYINYAENEENLIEQVKAQDGGLYRIDKTLNRDLVATNESFYCNEALAYGYYGVQHYSSSYEKSTGDLLASLGYCRTEWPTFYHEPIIGADSLLGVKYLLSENSYDGYEIMSELQAYNRKRVYKNNYALPLAFYADEAVLSEDKNTNSPFEYLNEIYGKITGTQVELYTPYKYASKTDTQEGVTYTFEKSSADRVLYLRAVYGGDDINYNITVDSSKIKPYKTGWMNHNVTVIGNMASDRTVTADKKSLNIEFYTLSLERLKEVTDTIKNNAVSDIKAEKSSLTFTANGGGNVMLTVPFDENWEVKVNGKTVKAEKGTGGFTVIPLADGENTVVMKYHAKGVKTGIVLFAVSVVTITALSVLAKKKKAN